MRHKTLRVIMRPTIQIGCTNLTHIIIRTITGTETGTITGMGMGMGMGTGMGILTTTRTMAGVTVATAITITDLLRHLGRSSGAS